MRKAQDTERPELLRTDCSKCAALCCLALAFDKGADFAFSKNPGQPCENLTGHQCNIHARLDQSGMHGCVAYDCLGAGNHVVQAVFGGQSWQDEPRLTRPMMEAFAAMREVHIRLDKLYAGAMLPLSAEDEITRKALLEWLETTDWRGDTLANFEVEHALEVDLFFHAVGTYVPLDPNEGW